MAISPCLNKMIFANACHSGGVRQEAIASQQGDDRGATQHANVLTFMSSRSEEVSYAPLISNGYSFFVKNLLAAMRGAADADSNGIVTAKELFTYVYQGVLRDSGNVQHPVMWGRFPNDMPIITLRK
ncbi:MAG: caspase family protein [Muribaculaceae bacterium]